MFDMTRSVDLKGKVVQFKWTNPHAWLVVETRDANGAPVQWNVEMNSPNNLMLLGWKRSTLKAGDDVTITVHPLRGDQGRRLVHGGDAGQRHEDHGLRMRA